MRIVVHRSLRTLAASACAATLTLTATTAGMAGSANVQSAFIAGYDGSGAVWTSANAGVKLPSFTCPTTGSPYYQINALWEGTAPDGSYTQAGLRVALICSNGALQLNAFVAEQDSTGIESRTIAASPGDTLRVTITPTSGGFKVVGRNVTTGTSRTAHGYRTSAWNFAQFNFFSAQTPVLTFTSIGFIGLTIDSQPLAARVALSGSDLYNGTNLLVAASALNTTGNAFHDKFVAPS